MDLRPLTARSVMLSTLLGSHPPQLPVRALIGVGEVFGIAEGTVRVALSRMAADGDVVARDGRYRLSERLIARQRTQDEAREPSTRPWRGDWEWAILATGGEHESGARALRLAAVRDGVWARPANLARSWPADFEAACTRVDGRPAGDVAALAARMWDLGGWAERAEALLRELDAASDPARRFVVGAAMLRHLRLDPLLPAPLLPPGWPGTRLRRGYRSFERDFTKLLRQTQPAATSGS